MVWKMQEADGSLYEDMAADSCFDATLLHLTLEPLFRFLLGGSHRLHRNGISVGCARDFGLLPSQLAEFVQRGLIRGVKGIDFVADYQSVLSAFSARRHERRLRGRAPPPCA
jgi:hypothetical protein